MSTGDTPAANFCHRRLQGDYLAHQGPRRRVHMPPTAVTGSTIAMLKDHLVATIQRTQLKLGSCSPKNRTSLAGEKERDGNRENKTTKKTARRSIPRADKAKANCGANEDRRYPRP